MIPTMIAFDTLEEMNDFLNTLGVPCQAEEPKKEEMPSNKADKSIFGNLTDRPFKQPLTGGGVNYYTVKVKGHPVECNDVSDALRLTPNEFNIVKEIWRTANARLGNGKPGHTALYGAEKVAYYANRILGAEKQKA